MDADDRYVVISADCHAGAAIDTYRDYLDPKYRDEFDAWRSSLTSSPWADLNDPESLKYRRNFEPELRIPDLEKEGIVGEVIFPNTIPPFLGGNVGSVKGVDAQDLERKWAGIRAHNRWLVDFCDELPGRRAGIAQILADDLDRAVEELHWISESRLFGGVLLPLPPPNSGLPPLHAPDWEPIWTAGEELGVVVNTHSGGGVPDHGNYPSSGVMMFLEFAWYAQRPLIRLLMSGVMERHPGMTFVVTETGSSWVPEA